MGPGAAGFGNGGKGGGGSGSGGGGLGISGPLNFTIKEFEPAGRRGRTAVLGFLYAELHRPVLSVRVG
jgi:hypothetical protein